MNATIQEKISLLSEVIPKTGIVIAEREKLSEMLCKPKILPLRSQVLEQLKKVEQAQDNSIEGEKQ
jgi:hypothetical protein